MEKERIGSGLAEIIKKNEEGLEKLADEKPAEERRNNPIAAEAKRLIRKYVKKPKAEPAYI